MKYWNVMMISIRHGLSMRAELVVRVAFFGIIMLIFSKLWGVTMTGTMAGAGSDELNARQLIWYLAVTEWIVLSIPMIHSEIQTDVKSGEIAYQLGRPISYLYMSIFKGLGYGFVRLTSMGIGGFFVSWFMAGGLPDDPMWLIYVIPLGILSLALSVIWMVIIGICAFWLQESTPLYWIWQKLMFILGGLMLPLSFYPDWMQTLSSWTPFSPMLYGPASSIYLQSFQHNFAVAGVLVLWIGIAFLISKFVYSRGMSSLDINGG